MSEAPRDPFRAFVALHVPGAIKRTLLAAQGRMKKACPSRLKPRWIVEAQMHVTLKFLGDVPRSQQTELEQILKRHAAAASPIQAVLDGVLAFGRPRRARALVASVTDPDGAIESLLRSLEDAVEPLGIAREDRDFHPHVTLARLKRPGNADAVLEAADFEPTPVLLDEVRLYESVMTREGGVYTVLASARLGGA